MELACAAGLQALASSRMKSTSLPGQGRASRVVHMEGFSIVEPVVVTDVRIKQDGESSGRKATTLKCVVDDMGSTEIYSEAKALEDSAVDTEYVLHASGHVSVWEDFDSVGSALSRVVGFVERCMIDCRGRCVEGCAIGCVLG